MKRIKVGLALSGGGARGFSHVGVLNVLERYGINIDIIAGTSAGAIVGAAFAAGMAAADITSMSARAGYRNLMRLSLSPLGILSNAPMGRFLSRELPVTRFEDLKIPFGAIVYDSELGTERLLYGSGDLIFAVRASCAVPGIFAPLKGTDKHLYVDGGVSSPLPIDAAKALGADVVIAVDLIGVGGAYKRRPKTAAGMAFRSALGLIEAATRNQAAMADVTIVPRIAHLRPDQIRKREEFISLGEAAAEEKIGDILTFIGRDEKA